MAVDLDLVEKDMYPGTVGDLDRGSRMTVWTYDIHATQRPRQLGRPPFTSGSLLGDLLDGGSARALPGLAVTPPAMDDGRVVRLRYVGSRTDQAAKVVQKETHTQ